MVRLTLNPQVSRPGLKLRVLNGSAISATQPSSSIEAFPSQMPSQARFFSCPSLVSSASPLWPNGFISNQ